MLPISKELETLDMGCDFDIDKENIPSITTYPISMFITHSYFIFTANFLINFSS